MELDRNLEFYDELWSGTHLEEPHRFNTWSVVRALSATASGRLELGPGLRPRLPIEGTCFVDISRRALERLRDRGGAPVHAEITSLPLGDGRFDLVAAFDIVEHVADDASVFREVRRVLKEHGVLVLSVPLHVRRWTRFNSLVGHVRRYEPEALERAIHEHAFVIERSAAFGMQPRSQWLLDFGTRMLERHRAQAMRWYNRFLLPLALRLQRPLRFEPGFLPADDVDEIVLVCRREETRFR